MGGSMSTPGYEGGPPKFATPEARLDKLDQVFRLIEEWTQQFC
jgi:hypothetical protein